MFTPAGFTLGQPGDLRKTFNDGVFDLLGGAYAKFPCRLAAGADPVVVVRDGLFISPSKVGADRGRFVAAPDANGALYLVFTARQEVMFKNVTPADEFPGEHRTDTPTGLMGRIEGIWPAALLDLTGGATLASFTEGTALTVKNGKLSLAAAGDRVVGHVTASAATLGAGADAVGCAILI